MSETKMKRCSGCGVEKPLEEFPNWKFSKDGKFHYCKECWRRYHREYYQKNILQRREYLKKWMEKYREKKRSEKQKEEQEVETTASRTAVATTGPEQTISVTEITTPGAEPEQETPLKEAG